MTAFHPDRSQVFQEKADALAAHLLVERIRQNQDPESVQQGLERLLQEAPLAEETLELAAIWLQQEASPERIHLLLTTADRLSTVSRQPQIAVRYGQLCAQVCPTDVKVLVRLFFLYQQAQRYADSIPLANRIYDLATSPPDLIYANYLRLGSRLLAGGYWDEIQTIFAEQAALIADLGKAEMPPDRPLCLKLAGAAFSAPYIRDDLAGNRHLQNQLMTYLQSGVRSYAAERCDRYRQGMQHRLATAAANRPLRLGYVSKCLKNHSVGWLARWLLQHHDRDRFQVYGYFWDYHPDQQDELQTWFLQQVDQARTFGKVSLAIADQIFADEIDLLIDLDSATAEIMFEVLALKPAPLQVTWLGWDALGSTAVDYFIVDPYVLPEGAEAYYAEKLWRLPQTYLAIDGFEIGVPTLRRQDLELPQDAIVYWSGQTSFNQHPDCLRAQLQILKAVPNSYFLIKGVEGKPSLQQYWLDLATEEGVNRDRLRFLPNVAHEFEHRANLAIADVVLDTYPYNGATTTLETLWMGIPLVTRVGEQFSSRNSYTLLRNVGVTAGIAHTWDDYIQWGIRFGTDADLRQQVSWQLWQSRQSAPLWNARQFTRQVEQAYAQMWQTYQRAVFHDNRSKALLSPSNLLLSRQENPTMPLNLHIGGQEPHSDWKILDIESRPEVDYVGDAANLSQFADGSVDNIYASHVLEHFHHGLNQEVLQVLREWHRVLKPGGRVMISVPDLKTLCWLYLNPNLEAIERHELMRIIFGGQMNPYDIHRVGFDFDTLGLYLSEVGFAEYKQITEFNLFRDCSSIRILDTLISLNVIAHKANE